MKVQVRPEITKKLVLKFPKRLIDQPVIYQLTKEYELKFNILKADIKPDEEGILVLELSGKEQNFVKGIEYLRSIGVEVQPLSRDLKFDKERCTSCGVCIPICPVGALVMNEETFLVEFIEEKCIACELCIKICPPKAIKLEF